MIVSVDEAAQNKWCPLTREVGCFGPGCMAWRWHDADPHFYAKCVAHEPEGRPKTVPADWIFVSAEADDEGWAHWREPETSVREREIAARRNRRGYCGMAGGPGNG